MNIWQRLDMQNTTDNDEYSLDELIKKLEYIRDNSEGFLNYPKAFYILALEIKKLKSENIKPKP